MRLDHIAYRVKDRKKAAEFFIKKLGYKLSNSVPEGFEIYFEDGSTAKCLVLQPPEADSNCNDKIAIGMFESEFHAPPEIFVSDGSENSIVRNWVTALGPGIHHLAYEVDSVKKTMEEWKKEGIEFTTEEPLTCPGLVQVFTKRNIDTGMIYELIERTGEGFCKENVKDLMKSTKKEDKNE